ncbi:MAG TPA: SDR family oxidoreductase [Xanthobacteraceae bacterium]|nr:SDR family oxidoreductase [Xanthobacteraceae bacterium]
MTPVAIITGASAGIGAELARVFARNGHALVLIARRADRLKALAAELAPADRPAPLVLPLDLARADAVGRIQEGLAARAFVPQYVVNNAGFGLLGAAAALDRDEQLAMIDLNVRVLTDLSLAFIDSLAHTRGGLLNVGSVAGFFPAPGMAVYYATKAYVLSFSEALHRELAPRGIRVTCLCPGPVETEFGARAGALEREPPSLLTVSATRVAEEGYRGLMRGRRLVVPGLANKVVTFLPRIVPKPVILSILAARQRRRTPSPALRT